MTPNQLTVLSTLLGLAAAATILNPNYYLRVAGIAAWFLAYVLDFCDGEVARYKNMQTEFGHWFDEVTDRLKDVGLFTAVTLLAVRQSGSLEAILFGLLALGGTMVYSYAITYHFHKGMSRESAGFSPEKFGQVNYLVMAILVGVNQPMIFLLFVTIVTYCGLAFTVNSSRHTTVGSQSVD